MIIDNHNIDYFVEKTNLSKVAQYCPAIIFENIFFYYFAIESYDIIMNMVIYIAEASLQQFYKYRLLIYSKNI